jgi:hypothetical protein
MLPTGPPALFSRSHSSQSAFPPVPCRTSWLFDEALVYYDDEALYFESRGKDSGIVRLSFEMLETLKRVVDDEEEGAG